MSTLRGPSWNGSGPGGQGMSICVSSVTRARCKASASGTAKVYGKVLTAFKNGNVYVTVSTAKNPKGEIRGQIAPALG